MFDPKTLRNSNKFLILIRILRNLLNPLLNNPINLNSVIVYGLSNLTQENVIPSPILYPLYKNPT